MAPRKAPITATAPIPPANTAHPARSHIPAALAPNHPHSASYHSFITSPFLPSPSDSAPPPKKRARTNADAFPELLESPLEAAVLHAKLLKWFDGVKETRQMPWRKEVDPAALTKKERSQRAYEVWVSEIMLQQTQVSTVIGYWTRWMERFPTVAELSRADIEDVNEVWKGLGYYSRASRLHKGAKTVMEDFGGRLPETAKELEKVDGIGPYSAGAISSIAFAARSPLVDGNVTRVFSRLLALHASATAKSTTSFIWALADLLVPSQPDSRSGDQISAGGPNKPGAWNQALMELGATVCTPKAPKCSECPLSEECLAFAEVRFASSHPCPSPPPPTDIESCALCSPIGDLSPASHEVTIYPMAKERKKQREEETAVCVLEWESSLPGQKGEKRVLLVKRPEKGLLAGLFEFPAVDLPPSDELSTALTRRKALQSLLATLLDDPINLSTAVTKSLPPVTQVYSHIIRIYHPLVVSLSSPKLPSLSPASTLPSKVVQSLPGRAKWVKQSTVAEANVGGAVERIWEARERDRKGLPPVKEKEKRVVKGKGPEKGQTTLSFGSSAASKGGDGPKSAPRSRKLKDGCETEESADEVMVLSEEDVEDVFVPSASYKKRRIVVASDEEE